MPGKKGLDEPQATAFSMAPEDLTIIGIDTPHTEHGPEDDGTRHPLYQDRIKIPVDPHKVANVIEFGVIKSITVRKEGDKRVVVDGRQRVRWAREANKRLAKAGAALVRVTVILKRGDEKRMNGVMIAANAVTEAESVMTRARHAQQYLDMGHTEEQVALAFGVSKQAVRHWLAMMDLTPKVKKLIDEGKIGPHAASKLSNLPPDEQLAEAEKLIESGRVDVGSAIQVAREKKAAREGRAVTHYEMPKKRVLKKLIDAWEQNELPEIDPNVIKTIRYMTGSMHPNQIKGLSKALGKFGAKKGTDDE